MDASILPGKYLLAGVGLSLAAFYAIQILLAPLSKIPGPWYSKWTSAVHTYHWLNGTQPIYVHSLHEAYGPVVRVSPSKVDITDITAIKTIYAIKDAYRKSSWYRDLVAGGAENMFSTTSPDYHRRQRRLLGGTMAESSLKNYLPTVTSRIDLAVSRMREEMEKTGAVDVWKWWLFMATDVIGELTFGESFKMLEQGKKTEYTEDLEKAGVIGAIRATFPTLVPLVPYIPLPLVTKALVSDENLGRYATESVTRYQNLLASDPTRAKSTVFTKIFQAKDEDRMSVMQVRNEAMAFIVAGTDTTANTLTYLVWSVCRHPHVKAKLMEEINGLPDDYTFQDLLHLPYLTLVVEETLRLHAVVPAALPRTVPPSGASLGGHWLPAGSTVSCQSYSMHRDPVAFPDAELFLPERWENPTKAMKDSFMAFGRGSRVCLGMHLAYMELRLGTVKFFREFPRAVMSSKNGMCDDDMEPLLFFLVAPKGKRCLIDEESEKSPWS